MSTPRNPMAFVTLAFGSKGWYTSCGTAVAISVYVDHPSAEAAMAHAQAFLSSHGVGEFHVYIRVQVGELGLAMLALNHVVKDCESLHCEPFGRCKLEQLPDLVPHMHMLETI